jgi:hypothetical protein
MNSSPVGAEQRRAAVEAVVRRLGVELREPSQPIPKNAEICNVHDGEEELTGGEEDADDSVNVSPGTLADVLKISVADATRILKEQPLQVARDIAARAATALKSTEVDGDEQFGRWLPMDRYSLDQVPCNLVEGDQRTYHFKGADEHVWVAGSGKGDEGKRFCSLQVVVRFVNGDKTELYAGQPWPEICFRGQGKRVTAEERAAWHPKVWVRFQPKAWYDEATCLKYAKERFRTVTDAARREGRESVLIVDNLYGQTTDEFKTALLRYSNTKVHLLPGGVTDLIQLIDAGFGYLVKFFMGEFHSAWMLEGDNLAKWTEGMVAWQQRAHMTWMLAPAYEKACQQYDFEKVARKLGMLLTIGDEPCEGIKLQGLGEVSFTDSDGGSEGANSDDDTVDDDSDDDTVDLTDETMAVAADVAAEEEGGEEELVYETSDDEEDDTDPQCAAAAAAVGSPSAPLGFEICTEELKHENDVIGKTIMVKLASPPLEEAEYGWYRGHVQKQAPGVKFSFLVCFNKEDTMGIVPPRYNKDKKNLPAYVPLPVTPENRGIIWYLLKKC